jgi:hypothetical protein
VVALRNQFSVPISFSMAYYETTLNSMASVPPIRRPILFGESTGEMNISSFNQTTPAFELKGNRDSFGDSYDCDNDSGINIINLNSAV